VPLPSNASSNVFQRSFHLAGAFDEVWCNEKKQRNLCTSPLHTFRGLQLFTPQSCIWNYLVEHCNENGIRRFEATRTQF
jgi:hypothetical protein